MAMLNQRLSRRDPDLSGARPYDVLAQALLHRTARIGVVGLGYVGLPLAMKLSKAGFSVAGIDIDPHKVQRLNQGKSYIDDVKPEEVVDARNRRHFTATTDFSVVRDLDVVVICVPTPFTRSKDPDLSFVISAAAGVVPYMRPAQLFVLESTSFPGTTEEAVLPVLARSGLEVGQEIFLAFSPERIDPGNAHFGVHNTPKVVGGVTPHCGDLAVSLYAAVVGAGGVHRVSGPKVAEMTKLLENTYRAVNIALVNELALLCDRMNIDVWEVITAAATKPFGYQAFYPGPGVGGHCIPVDPYYLAWKAREFGFHTRFIELAAEVNNAMPGHVVERISSILNEQGLPLKGSKILLIGAAFKPNVSDERNSPAVLIAGLLKQRGAIVCYHDPLVPTVDLSHELPTFPRGTTLRSEPLTVPALRGADCTVLLVPHECIDLSFVVEHAKLLVDTRNVTRAYPPRPNRHIIWSTQASGPEGSTR